MVRSIGRNLIVIGTLGLWSSVACGPAGLDFEPAGAVFEETAVQLDPAAVVPFGLGPEPMAPTVSRSGDLLSISLPDDSLATGWEVVVVEGGETRSGRLEPGDARADLPKGTERAGLRAVRDDWRGPVFWADAAGAGASGLGSPPTWRWAVDPPWAPQEAQVVSAQVTASLLDPSGDDLVGSMTLIFQPVEALDRIELLVLGNVTSVRNGAGIDLTFTPTLKGVEVSLGSTAAAGATVTLAIDWRVADLAVSRSGRSVADASAELVYAGDGVAWFPRPADSPAAGSQLSFEIDAPDLFRVHTGATVTGTAPGAAGRTRWSSAFDQPLRLWPLLIAGDLVEASTSNGLALAALRSGTPELAPHAAELSSVLDSYVSVFGPLPGGAVTLAQVPDSFAVGYSGPGLVFIPTVNWAGAPTTWSRFLLAHELSHAWWAHASFLADPRDLWLIEGLADHSATRALELIAGPDEARAHAVDDLALLHQLIAEGYANQPGRDVPVRPDDPAQLQDYIYYLKGAAVLRYLEATVGRAEFDAGLGAYAAATRFADTDTAIFRASMETAAGADLGWFFDPWLTEIGFPAIAYEPYFREKDGAVEVSLGIVQRRGISGDATRPWRLPLTWEVTDGTEAAVVFGGCLEELSELVEPAASPCLP